MKKIVSLLIASSLIFASEVQIIKNNKNNHTYNEVDEKYKAESGFAFYYDENKTKKMAMLQNCSCQTIIKLLKKIADENEKERKIQEKIYKLLKKELDPEPEVIVKNGKKCIANSSAECFKFPIVSKDAKRIPAMKNWLENPNLQNTANYLKWQAKYFQEIFKRGNSIPLAIAQFGANAYPILNQTSNYATAFGTFDLMKKAREKVINSYRDRFQYLVFFGNNNDLDIINFHRLKFIKDKYKDLDFTIIVKNKRSLKLFDDMLKALYTKDTIKDFKKIKTIVNPTYFEKFHIYTTPSMVVIDKKDNKAQILMTGEITENYFTNSMFNYLENRNMVNYKKLSEYQIYKENQDKINDKSNYFRRLYDIDIDKLMKKNKSKK